MRKTSTKDKPAYTDDYHLAALLLHEPLLKKRLASMKSSYAKGGCPIPAKGFKDKKEYKVWIEKYSTISNEMERKNPTKGLPHPWLEIKFLLDDLEYDRKFEKFLEDYIFLGKDEYRDVTTETHWIPNESTGKYDLFIRVHPHTTAEHIMKAWPHIKKEQEKMTGHKGKYKKKETHPRTLDIFEIHERIKNEDSTIGIDKRISEELKDKYPRLTLSDIRKALAVIKEIKPDLIHFSTIFLLSSSKEAEDNSVTESKRHLLESSAILVFSDSSSFSISNSSNEKGFSLNTKSVSW